MTWLQLQALVLAFLASWQVKLIVGLIVIDLFLGIAAALKTKMFEWVKVADFYRTAVLPYVLGYLVLYVVIGFILPMDQLGPASWLNEAAVDLAGLTLIGTLVGSIAKSFTELYQKIPTEA